MPGPSKSPNLVSPILTPWPPSRPSGALGMPNPEPPSRRGGAPATPKAEPPRGASWVPRATPFLPLRRELAHRFWAMDWMGDRSASRDRNSSKLVVFCFTAVLLKYSHKRFVRRAPRRGNQTRDARRPRGVARQYWVFDTGAIISEEICDFQTAKAPCRCTITSEIGAIGTKRPP